MKQLRYIGKTVKQDETDQKTYSKLIMKLGEMKCNKETYIFLLYKPIPVS